MKELFEALKRMEDIVGNGVRVSAICFTLYDKGTISFRFDWPDDRHFQHTMAQEQIEYSRVDAFDMVAELAKFEYARDNPYNM